MPTIPERDPDWDVFIRYIQGETSSMPLLIRKLERGLFYAIRRVRQGKPIEEYEDIAQEAWTKAFENLNQKHAFNTDGKFRAWLFRIGQNLAIDRNRTERRHPDMLLPYHDPEEENLIENLPDPDPTTPADEFEQGELISDYLDCRSTLEEGQREVWRMIYEYLLPTQEIAHVLGLHSTQSVRTRFRKARQRMLLCLDGKGWNLDDLINLFLQGISLEATT